MIGVYFAPPALTLTWWIVVAHSWDALAYVSPTQTEIGSIGSDETPR